MRFEHLVEVNDPLNPLMDALTLNQIWQGLVLRVLEPTEFVEGLDEGIITARARAGSSASCVSARRASRIA